MTALDGAISNNARRSASLTATVVCEYQMEVFKQKYPVITTIPDANGYEVELIAPNSNDFIGQEIAPNLEHAYVYFMEYETNNIVTNHE